MERQPSSQSYDAIEIGSRFVSSGRTVSDVEHSLFTLLSGDWHPIHCDDEYAKATPMGRRVVHGSFGIALALGSLQAQIKISSDPLVAALGIKDWAFKAPLFVGDTVHIEVEIINKRVTRRGDRYIVERRIKLINQDGTILQEGFAESMWQLP